MPLLILGARYSVNTLWHAGVWLGEQKGGLYQGLRHDYCDWLQSCRTATVLSGRLYLEEQCQAFGFSAFPNQISGLFDEFDPFLAILVTHRNHKVGASAQSVRSVLFSY